MAVTNTVGGGVPDAPRRGEGTPPYIQTAKGAAAVSRGRDAAIFLRFAQKNPPPSGAENDGGKTQ